MASTASHSARGVRCKRLAPVSPSQPAVRFATSFPTLATQGALGSALSSPGVGYSVVYHIELYLLFATLIAIGPLVRTARKAPHASPQGKFGLAEFPG